MVYTVYILLSAKNNTLYVGCSSNLAKRLQQHNNGYVISTKARIPFVLIHQETFNSKSAAFNRERFLKSLWGSREKQKIKQKYINSVDRL